MRVIRVNRKKYEVCYDTVADCLILVPFTDGDVVYPVKWDDYRYTHGGETYRKAVEVLKELKREGTERIYGLE